MAYQTEESNTGGTLGSQSLFTGGPLSKLAQTFTASRDYTLQAVGLFISAFTPPLNTSGGIYSVSGGEPNSLLKSFTATATQNDGNAKEETIVLDSPLDLSNGVQYAIVLNTPATDFFRWYARLTGNSSYPDGVGLRLVVSSGLWVALQDDEDFHFRTFSSFSLTPTPGNTATGVALFPTLSWVID